MEHRLKTRRALAQIVQGAGDPSPMPKSGMITKNMKIGLSSAKSLQSIENRFGVRDQRLPSQRFICWALGPYVLEHKISPRSCEEPHRSGRLCRGVTRDRRAILQPRRVFGPYNVGRLNRSPRYRRKCVRD